MKIFNAIIFSLLATISITSHAQTWQESVTQSIEIGIRDKWGDSRYVAEFIVTSASGKSFVKKIQVDADEFATVIFPKDFNQYGTKGKYTWKVKVNGEIAIKGKFTFSE
jgi:hypothetical protein